MMAWVSERRRRPAEPDWLARAKEDFAADRISVEQLEARIEAGEPPPPAVGGYASPPPIASTQLANGTVWPPA